MACPEMVNEMVKNGQKSAFAFEHGMVSTGSTVSNAEV
jgi:hypothetical protein